MKRFPTITAVALVALALACRSTPKEDPILRLSAVESLAMGKKLFESKKYDKARPYFSHAFEVEPNSAGGREALLLGADSLFLQGGSTNFLQSEAKYRDFQNRFPTSDRAPYVQFQIGRCLAERMERPDRDQKATYKAREAFEELLRLYPTSEYAEQANSGLAKVNDNLAEHEFLVGQFYLRFGLPLATVERLEALLERYPTYRKKDAALWTLATAYDRVQRPADATKTFAKLREEYPQSAWVAKIPSRKSEPS